MRSRKGMSPLIATVLLIAFAVALGAMIMNWSTEEQELPKGPEPQAGDPCAGIAMDLSVVGGNPTFCYQDNAIKFVVVNSGAKEIAGIQLRTLDANLEQVKQDITGSKVAVGDTFSYDFSFDKSGKVHVELVPFVYSNNQPQYCTKGSIIEDVLRECGG